MSSPTQLVLYTTTTTPLVVRYPTPPKQQLVLPAIVHQTLHTALDRATADSFEYSESSRTLRIPAVPEASVSAGLDPDLELTVKLHLLARQAHDSVPEALETLKDAKGWTTAQIDTLLVGFKGVDYKGKRTAAGEMFGCGSEYWLGGGEEGVVVPEHVQDEILKVWEVHIER